MAARSGQGRHQRFFPKPALEGLEDRRLLATALPDIAMTSASTPDSKSVIAAYEIHDVNVNVPLTLGVYRSAEAQFSPDDVPVAALTLGPGGSALDLDGMPATTEGTHRVAISIPGGLTQNARHPFVLVVDDPAQTVPQADRTDDVASFQKVVVGVVTHGGLENMSYKTIPPWVHRMAVSLKQQGYDAVIPFNWVSQSGTPGAAIKQGARLAATVLKVAGQFPSNEPVDLHFIGHSEGTVVNAAAIRAVESHATPQIKAGFLQETLLDPHAANNAFPGRQYDVSPGLLGSIADMAISNYQGRAHDPLVNIPPGVDQAQVYFQHTPEALVKHTNDGIYNLWGQVPVAGDAHATYIDLTGRNISHSGDFTVHDWYQVNVVPTLGNGGPAPNPSKIAAAMTTPADRLTARGASVVGTRQPRFAGSAPPGTILHLIAVGQEPKGLTMLGSSTAGADGSWGVDAPQLADGRYFVVARAYVPPGTTRPHIPLWPTVSMGPLVVDGGR
jgi:hypothetical protein